MTFDEQLQRSLGTFADHLHDEITRAFAAAGEDVAAHANQARDAAVRDASALAREEAEATARQERQEIVRLERRVDEMTAASASFEQHRAADAAMCGRVVDAVRALDRASSLTDILDELVDRASLEAARVGLLLRRHGELRGWRFSGFGPALDPARSVVVRVDERGMLGQSVLAGTAVASGAENSAAVPAFAELPGGREALAVPLVVSGDVAAVLYADQGTGDDDDRRSSTLKWSDALEVLARHAARCLEAATAIKAVRVLTEPPEIAPSASSTARTGVRPPVAGEYDVSAQSPERTHSYEF
jgi:hypothetical protein